MTGSAAVNSDPILDRETLLTLERAGGALATRAVARMDERLPWFRSLSAADRSRVTLVAQAGIAGFSEWLATVGASAETTPTSARIAASVFSAAPPELLRSVSLRRTVELVRVTISVTEEQVPSLVAPEHRDLVSTSLLRYSREIAFSAAAIYAGAAEVRGAWDDRLEAMVIDAIVRGEDRAIVESRAAALNWDAALPVTVLVGTPHPDRPGRPHAPAGLDPRVFPLLLGTQGNRLLVVLAGPSAGDLGPAAESLTALLFDDGPVIVGPPVLGLGGAVDSARQALSALRAVAAWPGAPRPVRARDLLTERLMLDDADARAELRDRIHRPLVTAGGSLIDTVDAYARSGGALEPAARDLFVHPNTVRYRLHRVAEVTGLDPWRPRDLRTLESAIALGRMDPDTTA